MALSVLSCYVSYNVISRLGQRGCRVQSPRRATKTTQRLASPSRRLEADRNQSRTRICLAACSPAAARCKLFITYIRKGTSSRAVNIEARRIARDTSPCQGVKAARCRSVCVLYALRGELRAAYPDRLRSSS